MGQKVNPHGMRVGIIKDWNSKWYAEADFFDNLVEDYNIRKFLKKKLYSAGVSKIDIERASDRVKIIIFTAKPGIVIGKGGAEIEKLKGELAPYVNGKKVFVDIKEVKRPDKEAVLVAENIAAQLENRVSFRRAMKSVMSRAMKSGALGIKTTCSGRPVQKLTAMELSRCRLCVLTLIMVSQRQTLPTVRLVLRFGSTRVRSFLPSLTRKGAINNYVNAKES